MRRLHFLFISFLTTLFVAFVFTAILIHNLDSGDINPSWERRLVGFDNSLTRYRFRQNGPCKAVIVGTSYARSLREDDGIYNLALGCTFFADHKKIIQHFCDDDDLVLYVFTYRELAKPAEHPEGSPVPLLPIRYCSIAKATIQDFLYLRPIPDMSVVHESFTENDARLALLQKAANAELRNLIRPKTVCAALRLWASNQELSLKRLHELYLLHPNIIFVVSPVLPLDPISESSRFAHIINRSVEKQAVLESRLDNSALPYINLSKAVCPDDFYDLVHYNKHGREVVRSIIVENLSN